MMVAAIEFMHNSLGVIVDVAILLFEYMGVAILIYSGLRGMQRYITRNPLTRLNLAKGMSMGLEFKLGSEILRTVVVRDYKEILTVGGIIILRAALTLLIHWEIKNEEVHIPKAKTKAKVSKKEITVHTNDKVNGQ